MRQSPSRKSRAGLYFPFILALMALGGWTVWWFILAGRVEQGIEAEAKRLRTSGYEVKWDALDMSGWPFRVMATMTKPRLAAPSGHAVEATVLEAEATAYDPRRWVVAAPDGLIVTRGAKGKMRVGGKALRASIVATERGPRVVVEMRDPTFTNLPGAQPFPITTASQIDLHWRPRAQGTPGEAEFLFRMKDAHGQKDGALSWISGGEPVSAQFEGVASQTYRFDGETWAKAVRTWSEGGGALTAVQGEITAGEAKARASSPKLSVDTAGRLQGDMALELSNGPAALAALGRSPSINAMAAGAAATAAAAGGGLTGDVRMTLRFEGGRSVLGPVSLAPAPKIY